MRDPDSARREFDCEWLGGGASLFFDEPTIKAWVDASLALPSVIPIGDVVAVGGDIGLVADSSACAVMSRDREHVITLRELVELRPKKGAPLKLSQVVATFCETTIRAGADRIMADAHEREPAREYATTANVAIVKPHHEGQSGKFETYEHLRRAMREGRVRLPNHPRLLAQLRLVVVKPQPAGGWKVKSPRRAGMGHGDCVSAVVLAAWQIRTDVRRAAARAELQDTLNRAFNPTPPPPQKVFEYSERVERAVAFGLTPELRERMGIATPTPVAVRRRFEITPDMRVTWTTHDPKKTAY